MGDEDISHIELTNEELLSGYSVGRAALYFPPPLVCGTTSVSRVLESRITLILSVPDTQCVSLSVCLTLSVLDDQCHPRHSSGGSV